MDTDALKLSYMRSLFTSIIIMLLPFIIVNSTGKSNLLLPLIAISFSSCTFLVLKSSLVLLSRIDLNGLFISLIYFYICSMPLISNIFNGINTDYFDIISVFAKTISIFMFFSLTKRLIINSEAISKFHEYFLWFGLIACVYNLYINRSDLLNFFFISSSYELTFKSFFSNRNQFGSFLFICFTILELYKKKFSNKLLYPILLILFSSNIILTMSRGAFLAVFVFYFYIYILKGNNFFLKMIIILVSVYSIFMIFISNSPVFLFIRNIILRPESGTTGRSDIWKIGIDVLKDNNFVNGLGLNTGIEFGKSRGLVLEQFHSFYIEVLLSGGFVELIFIAIIITSVFVNCKKLNKKTRYIVQGRILGFLSLGFFESVSLFSIGYVDILFSIMIIALPLLMVNSQKNFEEGELY